MQKWSPEEFVSLASSAAATSLSNVEFLPDSGGSPGEGVIFRREAGFTDVKSLMASLTKDERGQLYDLVQLEVAAEYEERERELALDYEKRLQAAQDESVRQMVHWSEEVSLVVATQLKDAAAATARLAKQIAEKIVRQQVSVDPEVVARVIETTLFKIVENTPLVLQVNPDDANWLAEQGDFLAKLNIGQIIPDRRVDPGGCLVRNSDQEWDATLTRQLDTLDDLVADMIGSGDLGTAELPSLEQTNNEFTTAKTEVDDVPSVD